MIEFIAKNNFTLNTELNYEFWINQIIESEDKTCGDITYIFCDDFFLDQLNQEYLNHQDYTDIISFDSSISSILSGDIFISTERVKENAQKFEVDFAHELRRVMAHGILHFCGFKDKTEEESKMMRLKEEEKMRLFHVEQS